jgi:hypothetical protein
LKRALEKYVSIYKDTLNLVGEDEMEEEDYDDEEDDDDLSQISRDSSTNKLQFKQGS